MSQNQTDSYWISKQIEAIHRKLRLLMLKTSTLFKGLNHQLPLWLILGIILLSLLPWFLILGGVNFGLPIKTMPINQIQRLSTPQINELMYGGLSGAFVHTILEWTAVATATFTAILSIAYLRNNQGIVVPVMGITLFFSGIMDGFHILAADRLVGSVANITEFVSFTWVMSRTLNGIVMIIGIIIFQQQAISQHQRKVSLVCLFGILLGILGYSLIHWSTMTPNLPQTVFVKGLIHRPYELLPAIIYGLGGIFVFARYFNRHPGLFSAGLVLSVFPNVAAQLHMAFGYTEVFDSHFNVGHFLKVVGYSIPLIALVLDYNSIYTQLSSRHKELSLVNERLNSTYMRLAITNQELEQINEQLEEKVMERTQELATAYDQITALNHKLEQENLRLSAEIDIARRIQEMILPNSEELRIHDLDIAGYMEPADEVGGDYFDVLEANGVVTIGIGDVTGHGLESGLLMLMTQTAVRTLKEVGEDNPVKFLDTVNLTIYGNVSRMKSDKALSLSVLNYRNGIISISGQHEEVIVIRKGRLERIDTNDLGFPIGLCEDIEEFINHVSLKLAPGDGIFLYTDGVTEAENIDNNQYGIDRLCEVVLHNWHLTVEEIKLAVIDSIKSFIGAQKVFDDISFVVFKRKQESSVSLY